MSDAVLYDPAAQPGDDDLRALLGERYDWYRAVLEMAPVTPTWKYYGKKSGWGLKLLEGKRNLCFVGVRGGELFIAFLFGEKAVERGLAGELPEPLKQALRDGARYPEGRGVRIPLQGPEDLDDVRRLLALKRER